jgi:hypothetical protein
MPRISDMKLISMARGGSDAVWLISPDMMGYICHFPWYEWEILLQCMFIEVFEEARINEW